MTTQKEGFALIPTGAKITAAVALLVVMGFSYLLMGRGGGYLEMAILSVGVAPIVVGYILLAGYVYGDARRRGMPPGLWTALAVLIPNAIGFVLYFLLRQPLQRPCGSCGCGIAQSALFCPKCGQPQAATAVS